MLNVVYVPPVVYVPLLKDFRLSASFSVSYGFLAVTDVPETLCIWNV